jgi:hypothetical protein
MTTGLGREWIVIALVCAVGCAGGNAADGADAGGGGADAPIVDVPDATVFIDADTTDAAPKKGFGEPCMAKAECESNICVFAGTTGVCSMVCNPPDCPMGYGCYSVLGGIDPGQVAEICVPENSNLCSPCTDSTECSIASQDLCIADTDGQKFCARDCSAISCPMGHTCSNVTMGGTTYKQCLPSSGFCDCDMGSTGNSKACMIMTPFGACLGSKTCNGAAGWGACQPPDPNDVPDGNFADDNCDGIDGDYDTGIFVSATSGADDATCGLTHTAPCQTVQKGILRALETARGAVYVQANAVGQPYVGPIVLQNSIDIYGGFNSAWVRGPRGAAGHEVRIVGGLDATDQQFLTVKAHNLVVTTIVADVVIEGPDATGTWMGNAGRSSYAVHANNSQGLRLERVTIVGGDGAQGPAGGAGTDAPNVNVQPGMAGQGGAGMDLSSTCDTTTHGGGGAAGTNACTGGSGTMGGAGGAGGELDTGCSCFLGACVCDPCTATNGDQGANGAQAIPGGAGQGGAGGSGGDSCGSPGPGNPGRVTNGPAGQKGSGSALSGAYWFSRSGTSGGTGDHGGGGGGGGGSGGCDAGTDSYGAGGGGGGAGGCAAVSGGGGGGGGGGSFGFFAVNSTATLVDCTVQLGNGAAGGAGGTGGRGQSGGNGGLGGEGSGGTATGGQGGKGGHGGHGGGGGGGAGGGSYGVFTFNSSVTQNCSFSGGSAGGGGPGGQSAPSAPVPERDGNPGPAGDPGLKATVGVCANANGC